MGVPEAGSGKAPGGPLIALVEDDELVRTLIFRVLSGEGYRVEAFANAQETLAWFDGDGEDFELMITDVVMPGMSGKELADEICKRRPGAKILFISGYSPYSEEDMNPCGNQRGSLLRKPFRPGELLERVESILDKKPRAGARGQLES